MKGYKRWDIDVKKDINSSNSDDDNDWKLK